MTAATAPTSDKPADELGHAARLQTVHVQALSLVEQLHALAAGEPEDRRLLLLAFIGEVQQIAQFAEGGADPAAPAKRLPAATAEQLQEFGRLLRDKRNAAGLSRVQLARRAKVSDSTIKFIEAARHPPSRATLIRLIAIKELGLTWDEVPGQPTPFSPERSLVVETTQVGTELNCFIPPTFDPVRMVLELGRSLQGAGGHVEQTSAYLDHQSAAAYLMCQQSFEVASLRASTPLAQAARCIVAATGSTGLQVLALGAGDAALEVRLVQHLLEAHAPRIELCLLDISQPLLACAYKHAADTLSGIPNLRVWGMQCNFHDLPLYRAWVDGPEGRQHRRRVFCLLGGTLANLDHEPRFFQHSLPACARGDLLLLDLAVARGAADDPAEVKKRDKGWSTGMSKAQAAWLSGPIWRHCKDVVQVEFHWGLDTHCPLPGSYALDAVATVRARARAERQFSMFRFRRYAPDKLAECLRGLGWEEIGVWSYGGTEQPSSLRLYCKGVEPLVEPLVGTSAYE